jgi:hypothetical protein
MPFLPTHIELFHWHEKPPLTKRDLTLELAIFLSNCIQKIQINQKRRDDSNSAEELELLKMATDLLIDMDHVSDGQESLAAGVLRMWKQFYDDVWVWGGSL